MQKNDVVECPPALDMVPVVRCKNCDLWNRRDSVGSEKAGTLVCSCAHWTAEDGPTQFTRPDDFCSYGEVITESEDSPMAGKPILDVACGGKMFYFDKNDHRVLFCDNRSTEVILCDGRKFSVSPDVQADFTALPFDDGMFKVVVFDPPHLTRKAKQDAPTGWQHIKYGSLNSDWSETLSKGFAECFRVLSSGGVLIFKWNETNIPLKDVLKCTSEKPVFGHKSGKRSNTHWLCFYKN